MIGSISKIRPCGNTFIYKYAHAETTSDLDIINEYRNEVPPEKEHFDFPLDNLENGRQAFSGLFSSIITFNCPKLKEAFAFNYQQGAHGYYMPTFVKKVTFNAPQLTNASACFQGSNGMTEFVGDLSSLKYANSFFNSCNKLKNIDINLPNLEDGALFFHMIPLETINLQTPKLSNGQSMFSRSLLDKNSTLTFVNSLPQHLSGSHPLTIGIHIDHRYDPEVNVALKKLQNSYITPIEELGASLPEEITIDKGWTIDIYWNGNATESEIIIDDSSLEYSTVALPENYTRCLYLQSDGTQYIDTEYIPTDSTGIWNAAKLLGDSECNAVGCRTNSIYVYTPTWLTTSIYSYYGWGSTSNMKVTGNKGFYESSLNFLNDRKAILRVPLTNGNYSYDLGTLTTAPSHSLYIFARNYNGNPEQIWNGRIYRVKISEGDQVVRDFIPCLNPSGKPCMYDIINGAEYINQGTGADFTYELYEG